MRYDTWDVKTTNDFINWFDGLIGFRGGKEPPVKCNAQSYKLVDMRIKRVLFNNPATIVFWSDGTKTVVKCGENEEFDKEKGLAMAISKRVLGNNYHYFDVFKRWIKEDK